MKVSFLPKTAEPLAKKLAYHKGIPLKSLIEIDLGEQNKKVVAIFLKFTARAALV